MAPVGAHLRVVAHAPQQAVGDARRAARPPAHLARGVVVDRHAEDPRRAPDDLDDVGLVVEVQPVDDAEARAQRRRQQPRARGGADQRELLQLHLHRSRARALADHDVELEVLHRRIEDLLDGGRHAVDLVDEQHLVGLESGQHAGQVARLLDHRSGRGAHGHAHLRADHVGERRLAEARAGRTAARDPAPRGGPRAAATDTCRLSRIRSWPMYSSSERGRSPASYPASSSARPPAITRSGTGGRRGPSRTHQRA